MLGYHIYKQRNNQDLSKIHGFGFSLEVEPLNHTNCSLTSGWKIHIKCVALVLTVVLPPEKAEGCESYLQYLHSEDGEREILRDANKAAGKKRISLDVSGYVTCNAAIL